MIRRTVRIRSLTVIAFLGLLPLSAAAAGLVFEQVTRSEGDAELNMSTRVWVSEQGARIETLAGPENPIFRKGSYMLRRPNDTAMIIVDPVKKTYMRFDGAQMMQSLQQAQGPDAGRGSKPATSDAKVEKLLDEEGPALLGYPTRHHIFHIMSTVVRSMAGTEMTMATDSTEESWSTEALGDAAVAKLLSGLGGMPGSSGMSSELRKGAEIKGIVLKRIVNSTTKMIPGKGFGAAGGMMSKMMNKNTKPSKTITEITKLEKENPPASLFVIPADYTETDLFGGGSRMPNLNAPGK